jgi:hypothetical protein
VGRRARVRGTGNEERPDVCAQMVLGIAAHDLYHTGQIQLTKRLKKGSA